MCLAWKISLVSSSDDSEVNLMIQHPFTTLSEFPVCAINGHLCNMLQVVVLQLHYHCHTHQMQCLCSRICGSILEIATIFTTIVSSYNNSYTNSGIYSTH